MFDKAVPLGKKLSKWKFLFTNEMRIVYPCVHSMASFWGNGLNSWKYLVRTFHIKIGIGLQQFVYGKGVVVGWKTIHHLQSHLKAFEITNILFQNGISHLGVHVQGSGVARTYIWLMKNYTGKQCPNWTGSYFFSPRWNIPKMCW